MHPTNLNSFLFLQPLLLTLYFLPLLAAVTAEVNHLKGEPCEQIHHPPPPQSLSISAPLPHLNHLKTLFLMRRKTRKQTFVCC